MPLLDVNHVASPHTKFGCGLLGRAKQAWFRDGRAYVPSERELLRLHEMHDNLADVYYAANPDAPFDNGQREDGFDAIHH